MGDSQELFFGDAESDFLVYFCSENVFNTKIEEMGYNLLKGKKGIDFR